MYYYVEVLKKYAVFNGRARRSEYWYFVLFNCIIAFVIGFIGGMIKMNFISTIYSLAVLDPVIAVGIRRLHDIGKSGWFILIPFNNIVLAATPGESGSNTYGADPKNI